jgi:hypothetical protein
MNAAQIRTKVAFSEEQRLVQQSHDRPRDDFATSVRRRVQTTLEGKTFTRHSRRLKPSAKISRWPA